MYSKRLKCTPAHPPPPPRFTLYTRLPCALYPFSLLSLISCEMASGVQDLQLVVFEVKQCLAIKKITPSVVIYSYPRTKPFMNKHTNTISSWMERLTETTDKTGWTKNITKTFYLTTKSIRIHVQCTPYSHPLSIPSHLTRDQRTPHQLIGRLVVCK